MASTGQSDISTYASRSREPCRIVNRCLEGERCDRAHTRHGHEPTNLRITASQFCNLTVKLPDLLLDGIARFEQRPDRSHQLRTLLDQLLGSYSEDIERATSDHETEVLEKAAHLVLEIALDLDQQCPTPQQCSDRVAVDILDMHLLEPTGLHDAGDPNSIVAVAFVDLHLKHCFGMARVDADSPVCKIKQTRFIGLTLWTDWAQAGRWMPDPAKAKANAIVWTARARGWAVPLETGPREYRAIKTERGLWTPYDAV